MTALERKRIAIALDDAADKIKDAWWIYNQEHTANDSMVLQEIRAVIVLLRTVEVIFDPTIKQP